MSTKNIRNIKAIYELAGAAEIADGMAWYGIAKSIATVLADQYGITAAQAVAAQSDLCEALLVSNSRSHNLTQSSREPYSRDHKSLVTLGPVPKLRSTMHNETMARLMR